MTTNTEFAEDFGACRDVERTRRLNPFLRSYSQWLEQNAERIPIG